MLEPFATLYDLEIFWRKLLDDETQRAESLLAYSSNKLRLLAENVCIDLDNDSLTETYTENLKYIVLESVKRAMSTPEMAAGAESYTQTAGAYSENYKFSNPSGDLYFTKKELSILGLRKQRMMSFSSARRDIYGDRDND